MPCLVALLPISYLCAGVRIRYGFLEQEGFSLKVSGWSKISSDTSLLAASIDDDGICSLSGPFGSGKIDSLLKLT